MIFDPAHDSSFPLRHPLRHGQVAGAPRPGSSERIATDIAQRVAIKIDDLLRAYEYAQDVGCDVWEFAVELVELKRVGLNRSDIRWLLRKGLAEHGRDVTSPEDEGRVVRRTPSHWFNRRSCLVLTPRGAVFFGELRQRQREVPVRAAPVPSTVTTESLEISCGLPHWDRDRQELRVGGMVIKQFKVPAPNQEMILAAFEEEGWPPRIDDPLPPLPQQDPKRRLHDTINSLNRNHKVPCLRFLGDGSGMGVRWERTRPGLEPVDDAK